MESLFNALLPQNSINRSDQQRMKDKVFQPTSFFVTEIKPLSGLRIVNLNSPSASNQELIQSSILVCFFTVLCCYSPLSTSIACCSCQL